MNQQTRYVMAIYELGVIIRDTLEYVLPPSDPKVGYNVDIYKQRKAMILHLVEENSPFSLFCQQNSQIVSKEDPNLTIGNKIKAQVNEFIEDVYADEGRIVKLDKDNKIVVESSLVIQLLDYIIGLHETIADVCLGFKTTFEKEGSLEADLADLLVKDDPFYRAVAFRAVAHTFNVKFAEYNNAVRTYIAQEKEKNGVDPSTQPGFDPKVDPSCAFINNEMARVVGFFNFLRAHNKSNDVIFLDSITRMEDNFHYFDGSKKLAEGQNLGQVMGAFESIFVPLIPGYRDAWVRVFNKIYAELVNFERDLINKPKVQNAANEATNLTNEKIAEDKKESK